jgi:hypothetical protein
MSAPLSPAVLAKFGRRCRSNSGAPQPPPVKSAWLIEQVRRAAAAGQTPLVVVATPRQAQQLRQRLAAAGGALGVHLLPFDELFAAILNFAGSARVELHAAARHRLLRVAVDELAETGALFFYAPLVARPGFIAALEGMHFEMRGARLTPTIVAAVLTRLHAPPRLTELAAIYTRYNELLTANGWTDRVGLGELALDALHHDPPNLPWSPLFFDGFDSFTVVQRETIAALAARIPDLTVLLTAPDDAQAAVVHRLFAETNTRLSARLARTVQPLPGRQDAASPPPPLSALAEHLFTNAPAGGDAAADVTLLAAADRAGEVRAALRWLKARIVLDGVAPDDLVVIARSLAPYRDLIDQTAPEFGLPVHFAASLPLRANPAVAALLDLLALFRPDPATGQPVLLRRPLIEAWRSPYFAWRRGPALAPDDADRLDAVARRYVVLYGLDQWREALRLAAAAPEATDDAAEHEDAAPAPRATTLAARFNHFVEVLTPPVATSLRAFVAWLETLIGEDTGDATDAFTDADAYTDADAFTDADAANQTDEAPPTFSLELVTQLQRGDPALMRRDRAALRAFKDVLRGLVWAEDALMRCTGRRACGGFPRFLDELAAAVALPSTTPQAPGRAPPSWPPTCSTCAGSIFVRLPCWGWPKAKFRSAAVKTLFCATRIGRSCARRGCRWTPPRAATNASTSIKPSRGRAKSCC